MAGTSVARGVPREILSGRNTVPVLGADAIPRVQFSTGSAQALQAFAQDLFSLSNEFQSQEDQRAQAQATVEGGAAGATGAFQERDYGTIRGRAYNQAAVSTMLTTMDTNSMLKVQELSAKYGSDPDALKKALDDYGGGAASALERVSPEGAARLRQSLAVRGGTAIEAAKDARFKLTRDQADAALIDNEVALKAEVQNVSADLFSDNPERSSAAAASVSELSGKLNSIYGAVDPTTGRPLYTAEEQAKARRALYENVMETAATAWLDQQPDKAAAYLRFTSGNFTINLQGSGAAVGGELGSAINRAAARYGVSAGALSAIAQIESGGRLNAKNPSSSAGGPFQFIDDTARRYGLTNRYDAEQASDAAARLMRDNAAVLRRSLGREPSVGELYLAHQQGAAGAATLLANPDALAVDVVGMKAVRLNGGGPGMTAGQFAAKWTKKADRVAGQRHEAPVDVRQVLGPESMERITERMRSNIRFGNEQADRADRMAERAHKAADEAASFELSKQLFGAGTKDPATGEEIKPLTREQVMTAVQRGQIDPTTGQGFLQQLSVVRPAVSDEPTLRDLTARVYAGEDIFKSVLAAGARLTPDDAADLMSKNQSLVRGREGAMTRDQEFQFEQLKGRLTPGGPLASLDTKAADRRFAALNEFYRRIKETDPETGAPTDPELLADELVERAARSQEIASFSDLASLIQPRFAVVDPNAGRVNIRETAMALTQAARFARISPEEFAQQKKLLKRWDALQKQVDAAQAARAAKKKAR